MCCLCLQKRSHPLGGGAESRRDQEKGGDLDSHDEVRHFCGSRRDQEEEGGVGPTSQPRRDQEQGGGVGLESWTSFASVVSQRRSYGHCLCDCSAQQLGQQLRGSVVAAQCRTDTALINILLFWRRSTAALVFRVGACFEVSLFCPPVPTRPRPRTLCT